MEQISRGFVGRTVRAVLFIILIILFCTAISSAGIYLASRFGLTRSREQVPLSALSLGTEGEIELPARGKMVEGEGWRLRNSRDVYTLTLDNAVIEGKEGAPEDSEPAIDVTGDLIIELKEGSGNWIRSGTSAIRIQSGTLVIKGKGSLDIEAGDVGIQGQEQAALLLEGGQLDVKGRSAGIRCPDVELAGSSGRVRAEASWGIGISACKMKVEESEGRLTVTGDGAAVAAAGTGQSKPSLRTDAKAAVEPEHARIAGLTVTGYSRPGEETEKVPEESVDILTYSLEDAVIYNNETCVFDGASKELWFGGK